MFVVFFDYFRIFLSLGRGFKKLLIEAMIFRSIILIFTIILLNFIWIDSSLIDVLEDQNHELRSVEVELSPCKFILKCKKSYKNFLYISCSYEYTQIRFAFYLNLDSTKVFIPTAIPQYFLLNLPPPLA
jgi:hypothetical protein